MCGIAGVLSRDKIAAREAVTRMMNDMIHRGPDDGGLEEFAFPSRRDGQIHLALGFRRLAILDLTPAGHQPMFCPRTGNCIVFNGEIYNHQSLRSDLIAAGFDFRGTSDTETLLYALTHWGPEVLWRLNGMYAFAFLEARNNRMLLARDPLGIKPLYVGHGELGLAFASEMRPMLRCGMISKELDPIGVTQMLMFGNVQAHRTPHRFIHSLPPGTHSWVSLDQLPSGELHQTTSHWSPPDSETTSEISSEPAKIWSCISQAVERQLVADVPVGVLLSAGLDSTIIAALARQRAPNIRAFTVAFQSDLVQSEDLEASRNAQSLGILHTVVPIGSANLHDLWSSWLRHQDSPSIDGLNTFMVCHALRSQGITVGLCGLGADELFGGYPAFRRIPILQRAASAGLLAPARVAAGLVGSWVESMDVGGTFSRALEVLTAPADTATLVRAMTRSLSNTRLQRLGFDVDTLHAAIETLPRVETPNDAFNAISVAELRTGIHNRSLRDADWTSMRHSVELRVPFLDHDVVQHTLAIPGTGKQGGRPKRLLKEAASTELPRGVLHRRKSGFTLPMAEWMRTELRDSCEGALDGLRYFPSIDHAKALDLWHTFCSRATACRWGGLLALVVLGRYLSSTFEESSHSSRSPR
jgi:asparagine synthase (glutamine-hydrolysing)